MKIVIATPILFDKSSPFNHLFRDILEGLQKAGHSITRIVAVEDEEDTGYTMGLTMDYIPVKRKSAAHGNIITRYITDSLTNWRMARKLKKLGTDVLFEDVSYSSWMAVRAAKKRGMQVVAMLQDVWPDNAVQSGLIREGSLLYKFFEHFQRYVYKRADRLICISDDMKEFLVSKGVPAERITVIYNWGYTDQTVDIPRQENRFLKEFALDPKMFYAVYAGNIGRMQNVEIVVEAAKLLQARQDIRFLIIGGGARLDAIGALAESYGLENVQFLPMQPSELAVHIYSAAGVNLIPLVKNGTRSALPSKTGVVLSCGRPAVFTFGTDSGFARLLAQNGAGYSVDPEDAEALAHRIDELSRQKNFDRESVYEMFRTYFVRGKNVDSYVRTIAGE